VSDVVSDGPKLLEPHPSEEAAPFWEATKDKQLVLPWCVACGQPFWHPRSTCPRCLGDEIDWRPSSGDGAVYAISVHHKSGPGRSPDDGPYAVALVELPEGVRLMANIVGDGGESAAVGDAVRPIWHPLSDGRHLIQFTLA
jgi:uncharacterized protein